MSEALPDRAEVVVIGGGVTGATLATVLARAGVDVLVLEKQAEYRDRAQGEALMPWGAVEARTMGVLDDLLASGSVLDRVYGFDERRSAEEVLADPERVDTLFPGIPGIVGIGHPLLTGTMAAEAAAAGARVQMGATVAAVSPGRVCVDLGGRTGEVQCQLVVGADGKRSRVRDELGFELHEGGARSIAFGMLAEGFGPGVPLDAVSTGLVPGRSSVVFPQAGRRARLYHLLPDGTPSPYTGRERGRAFLEDFHQTPMPWGEDVAAGAEAGPCARFPIFDAWVEQPCMPGAVLVGDAAGFSNPMCAQGIAICMRDVRMVAEAVLSQRNHLDRCTFEEYVHDRALRMSRLRVTAELFTVLVLPPRDPARTRAHMVDVLDRVPEANVATEPIHLGPYASPPEAFDRAHLEAMFGIHLGDTPRLRRAGR
jgi:2-polyprenyl-6-methoxyphenol hydroxylase-like FAD-dependent oxidoreductase